MATLGGAYNREIMVVPERNNADRTDFEFATDKLIHIGTFCHEFVHMMGTDHTAVTTYRWALMREGSKNGDVFGNRPASMNPWFLYQAGWAVTIGIQGYDSNKNLIYNTSPTTQSAFYAREFSGNRRYLIENRQQGNTYDDGLPHVVVGKPGGLLIWRIDGNGIYEGATSLLHADNSSGTDFSDMANDMFRPTGDYPYGKISDYSTPKNLKLSPTEFSRFAIDKFTQNANNITVDFIHNYWEGAISSNTTWSSVNNPYFVGGNITVNSGVTLTITAGTTVLFASGKKITVIGSLQALGTGSGPTEKITFDRSGASGTWNGLWIENSTANSNLNYCTVRNAATGIRLKNTSGTVTIDHATLTNNQIGFVSEYSSPFTIQNSTIQNNIAYGIWISSSAASGAMKILSNTIASNGTYHGVHLYNGADAFLGFNTITGHS